jgi:SPP1 gp7 family putative phage head morphogenesis protein
MLVAVAAFLVDQAARIGGRLGHDATLLSLMPPEELDALRETLEPWYRRVLAGLHEPAQATLGVSWGIEQPQVLAYLREAGAQITGIDETTRQAVARVLTEGRAAGLTPVQIQQALREDFAFSASRAETIARTELATAANDAALAHYQASGVVVGVRVFDGDYDAVCAAMNGRTFTLAEARSVPRIAHPRCRRALAPLTDAAQLQRTA